MATPMPKNATMGRKLRELREGRGIKREQIALALDMGAENWRHYEAGRTQPTVPMLPKIADAYGMSLVELLADLFELRTVRTADLDSAAPLTTSDDDGILGKQKDELALYLDCLGLIRRAAGRLSPKVRELAFA